MNAFAHHLERCTTAYISQEKVHSAQMFAVKLLFLLCLVPSLAPNIFICAAGIRALDDFNCTVVNHSIDVDLGWPYWISCDDFVEYDYDEQQYPHQCIIFDGASHKVLHNSTSTHFIDSSRYRIPVIRTDIANIYVADIEEDKICTLRNFTFNHLLLSNLTCEDGASSTVETALELVEPFTINCENTMETVKIHVDNDDNDFQTKWFYNCSSSLPKGVEVIKDHKTGRTKLFFPKVSLSHIGNYTCALTYKNRTRYFLRHSICIRWLEYALQPPTVKCTAPEVLTHLIGDLNITLRCVATFGFGRIRLSSFFSTWTREGFPDFMCKNRQADITNHKKRYSCIYYINYQFNDECIGDPDLAQRRNTTPTPATATLQLTLRNVSESDLGRYCIIIKTVGKENDTACTELKYEPTRVLSQNALIIGLCVGLTTLVFIILGILYYFRFYVAVYTKRWFGSYTPDDKKYDIVFSYHFSTSDDKHAQDQARTVISSIRLELDNLGYKLYDEHKDDVVGTRVVNVTTATQNSHRLLIVLTHDYIKDDWTMFHLQQEFCSRDRGPVFFYTTLLSSLNSPIFNHVPHLLWNNANKSRKAEQYKLGFKAMIDTRYRIIFVLVPGIKSYLEQHSATNETCRMIKRAIQLNHQIDWPEKDKLDNSRRRQFRLQMEHAMPKLKRHRHHIVAYKNGTVKEISLKNGQIKP